MTPIIKKNYRPVSILSSHSKVFEFLISEQITEYFDKIFHNYLAAFRKGFGCQTTLLRLAEDWKRVLDSQKYVGAVLMDPSKAFDCLPHDLIVASEFLNSYLSAMYFSKIAKADSFLFFRYALISKFLHLQPFSHLSHVMRKPVYAICEQ